MITLCTVIVDNDISCLRHLLTSLHHTTKITQIIIADANIKGKATNNTGTINGIPYRQIKFTPNNCMGDETITEIAYAHPLGLHLCIDAATTNYVMLIDSDVIFYKDVSKLFLQLYEDNDLGIIGIEHTSDISKQCYNNFPTVITALIKKSKLPPRNFLSGKLKYRGYLYANEVNDVVYKPADGKYLLPSPIPDIVKYYPNPHALFDVGCNLYYWFEDSKWLSFRKLNTGPTVYTTSHVNNFGLPQYEEISNLLFHCGGNVNRLEILSRASNVILV